MNAVLLLLVLSSGCSAANVGLGRDDGRLVGAPCDTDADCLERCVRDDPLWPRGLCTVADYQFFCPDGSDPIYLDNAREDIGCAVTCSEDDDCKSGDTPGLACVHDGEVEQWGTHEKFRNVYVCEASRS